MRQEDFDKYRLLRMNEAPQIEVEMIDSTEEPGGIGEPRGARRARICNAIFAATKRRVRSLPIAKHGFA